uniref:AlNc14C233G9325 protein n=1 Tax=Albugo laibachii Nc14 TaxID=890382 RepID=F0WSI2_9STRA|nr:AlNc14C233G9325 [Albugo laibachii Nc14]|eukprot:CCA24306.1 AlNc14C233G9325 [Albugo laibachii Nc14]
MGKHICLLATSHPEASDELKLTISYPNVPQRRQCYYQKVTSSSVLTRRLTSSHGFPHHKCKTVSSRNATQGEASHLSRILWNLRKQVIG